MRINLNVGIKIWACYFIITGFFGLVMTIRNFIAISTYMPLKYIFLLYPFLFSVLLFIVGIGLFRLSKIARKGAIVIAVIYIIGVIILFPFAIYYLINGKPVILSFLKIIFQLSIGTAMLLYFNRPSVKSFFK